MPSACQEFHSPRPISTRRRSRAAACSVCRKATRSPPTSPIAATPPSTASGMTRCRRPDRRCQCVRWRARTLQRRGRIVGGLGVSGDTSCADHNIAYRTRNMLELDYVPSGVAAVADPTRRDNIVFDIVPQSNGIPNPGRCRASAVPTPLRTPKDADIRAATATPGRATTSAEDLQTRCRRTGRYPTPNSQAQIPKGLRRSSLWGLGSALWELEVGFWDLFQTAEGRNTAGTALRTSPACQAARGRSLATRR